jgi:transcriptional regulator with XRE-family HTH domain
MKSKPTKIVWSEKTQGIRRSIGLRISQIRQAHGWSQEELADLLSIPRGRLVKWERGYNAPPPEDIVALSGVLGVSTDELLTGRKTLSAEIKEHIDELVALLKRST